MRVPINLLSSERQEELKERTQKIKKYRAEKQKEYIDSPNSTGIFAKKPAILFFCIVVLAVIAIKFAIKTDSNYKATHMAPKEVKTEKTFKMMNMTPGERSSIEAIQQKAEKPGFRTKIRYLYITKDKELSKPKGVAGFMGVLKQFALLNSNSFKPVKGTKTSVDGYLRVSQRSHKVQKRLLKNYKSRSGSGGDGEGFILNTEELATLFHFPYLAMSSESLQTVEVKRVGAPFRLPVEELEEMEQTHDSLQTVSSKGKTKRLTKNEEAIPPNNLPM
jgi:hypothetical protein